MDSDIPYPLEFMTDNNFINLDLHLGRNLKANPDFGSGPIRNIDSKQPGLRSVQSVPPIFTNLCHILVSVTVPHSKSGVVPRSSLLGVGQLGFWEVGKGGTIG